jgi:hypothetical protein
MTYPRPPFPDDWVDPCEADRVGDVGFVHCIVYVPRQDDGSPICFYKLLREPLYRLRDNVNRPILEGWAYKAENGKAHYALGVGRVESFLANGMCRVRQLPEAYLKSALMQLGYGQLRKASVADRDLMENPRRGQPLDAWKPTDPECKRCVRYVADMKRRILTSESCGALWVRVRKPCLVHGREEDIQRWHGKQKRAQTFAARDIFTTTTAGVSA